MRHIIEPTCVSNTFNEDWSRWEPIAGISGRYDIYKVSYTYDSFVLVLKNKQRSQFIEVRFPQSIQAVRIASESVVFSLYDLLFDKYGKDFYTDWTFFTVKNSDCLNWLSKGTYGASELYDLTHYVLSDLDVVIDVVTYNAPDVKILNDYKEI